MMLCVLYALAVQSAAAASEPPRILISPFHVVSAEQTTVIQQGIEALLNSRLAGLTCPVTVLNDLKSPVSDVGTAKSVVESRQGDYLIYGTVVKFGKTMTLDAFLYNGATDQIDLHYNATADGDADLLKHLSEFTHQLAATLSGVCDSTALPMDIPATAPDSKRRGEFESVSLWKSEIIKDDLVGLCTGDMDGDQHTDLIIARPHVLSVKTFDKGKLLDKAEFDTGKNRSIVGVDCADLNRNGRAEVFVSLIRNDLVSIDSMILEWDGTRLQPIVNDLPWIFRARSTQITDAPILLAQKNKALNTMLGSPIHLFSYTNQSYAPSGTLNVPMENPSLFSLALSQWPDIPVYALYAFNNHIRIYDSTFSITWESEETCGGSTRYLSAQDAFDSEKTNRLYLEPRLVFTDLDGDGKDELISIQNQDLTNHLFSNFKHYKKGRILFFKKGDLEWRPVFKTENVTGYISDFTLTDTDQDNQPELIYAVMKRKEGLFSHPNGYIVVHKWSSH